MSFRISEAELLEALAASVPGTAPENARTTAELAGDTGIGIARIRAALKQHEREGRLVTHRVLRPRLGGGHAWTAAFTVRAKP